VVGALDDIVALVKLEVGGRGFERLRGKLQALGDHLARAMVQRDPMADQRA
jgi:hypothetical protein